jgi:hypothetical protein
MVIGMAVQGDGVIRMDESTSQNFPTFQHAMVSLQFSFFEFASTMAMWLLASLGRRLLLPSFLPSFLVIVYAGHGWHNHEQQETAQVVKRIKEEIAKTNGPFLPSS